MRKFYFGILALAALAACSKEDGVISANQEAISFTNAFVQNGTRAADDSFTVKTDGLLEFEVWATTQRPQQDGVNQSIVPILGNDNNGQIVSRNDANSAWGYDAAYTQYWIAGNNYQFAAAKNYNTVTIENGVPVSFTYDAAGQLDLIYDANSREALASGNAKVTFTFNHLLSKAYFTVKTTEMSGSNTKYTYRISNICINNAVKEATYTVANETWAGTTNYSVSSPLTFGNVNNASKLVANETYTSDYARLLVPATYGEDNKLNITCTIETLYGDDVIDVKYYDQSIVQEFVKGYVYNFVLTLGNPGDEIMFTVNKVNEWLPTGDAEIPGL